MIRRVAAGIGMTTFDKLVVAATQLALVPILATHWGLALYGKWLLLATIPQFLSVSDLGFATAGGTRMTMAAARGDREEAISIFQSAWRAILASSGVIICLLSAAVWLLPASGFGEALLGSSAELQLTLWLLAIYGVFAVQGSIFFAGFRAANRFATGAFWNAMVLLIENAVLVAVVLSGGGLVGAAAAWLLGRLTGLALQMLLLRRMVPWLVIGLRRGSWTQARALLAPAGAVMLLPIAQALLLQGTALMVGAVAGPAAVPIFAATRTLSRVGMQMCWIVSTPLMPEFSAAVARDDRNGMATMVLVILLFSAGLVLPYALGFMALGPWIIELWTHGAIAPPVSLVTAMGFAILFGGVWYPISNLILACDRQASYTVWYAVLALFSLPAACLLVEACGVAGAGYAVAALDFVMLLVIGRLARDTLASRQELFAAVPRLQSYLRRLVSGASMAS
ncbi:lipopolysaccharide biosynthesis protein [Novosphingobium sp. RD2P27]|uniref:Lipopolysaccharide biosynthesis protein n=1 Tax=Novosphingobium kalidii TaxID=3230299 RepID=A0ABV2D0H0_9SPHN